MRWRRNLAIVGVGAIALSIGANAPLDRSPVGRDGHAPQIPPAVHLTSPDEAVRLAHADLFGTVSPTNYPYTRYLWVQDGDRRSMRSSSLALNYISRGTSIQKPLPVSSGYLLRVDLRQYAPRDRDLYDWLHAWEELAFDPSFARIVTKDTVQKQVDRLVVRRVLVPGPQRRETKIINHPGGPYVYPDDSGRRHAHIDAGRYEVDLVFNGAPTEQNVTETVSQVLPDSADAVRFNAPHIDASAFTALQELTRSAAPVVEHSYFKSRALTAIKDKGVYRTVFGGLYYEFRGVKKAKEALGEDTKATDLDLYFEGLGIGSIKGGVTSDALFDKLRSDQRVAVFRSLVTGKPREVSSFHTPADKEGGSWGAITGDIKDGDIDIGDNPVANLLKPRRKAREAIFPSVTSFPIFGLFNDKGERQDEVPPDIAVDSTIPGPHTRRLQPAIGCIRCHGTDGSDGYKPLVNDVKRLLTVRGLDSFGDFGAGRAGATDFDTLDRLAGLYAGDFSKNLRRARDDLAEATLKATGPWEGGAGDQSDAAKIAATRLASEHAEYWYDMVDARKALREIGVDIPAADAVEMFRRLVSPDLRQAGIILEDPRLGALRQGLSINRADWALSKSYAAERAQQSLRWGVKLK